MAKDYKQYNYPDVPYAGESIAAAGCGPTAVADLLEVDPTETAAWMQNNGYAVNYQGTIYEGISACLTAYGAEGKMIARDQDGVYDNAYFEQWRHEIKSGKMGILLMHAVYSTYWTSGGHYIAIVAYKNNQYLVYDPASAVRTGWHPFSDFAGNIAALYTCNKSWKDGITVDGAWGKDTTRFAQKVFKTTEDGIISNQNKDMKKFLPNCQSPSWEFVSPSKLKRGSDLVRAIQKMLGITQDGFFGMETVRALQKFLGVTVDGYFGGQSVSAWQQWLNSQ